MNTFPIVFYLFTLQILTEAINPIIIIPGMGGNHLEAKFDSDADINILCQTIFHDYFTIWMSEAYISAHTPLCLFNVLTQHYDSVSRTTSNVYGVHTRIPGFGETYNIEYLDNLALFWPYFKAFVRRMNKEGYKAGVSLRSAPYDLRKGPNELTEYFNNVKVLIEETYQINDFQPTILLGHSLGGLIALEFLNRQTKEWKNKYIRFFVAISPSWGGTVKALEAYVEGLTIRGVEYFPKLFHSPKLTKEYALLPSLTIAPSSITRRLPSLIWQFPWTTLWNKSEILVQTSEKVYTIDNMEELFNDLGDPDGWEMYKDLEPFMNNLGDPGVPVYCIYGVGFKTVETIYYNDSILDSFRIPKYGAGDGIVNLRSFEVCKQWKNAAVKPFWGVNHFTIQANTHVIEYIIDKIHRS